MRDTLQAMSDLIPWYAPWTHRGIIVLLGLLGLYLAWRMGWRRRRLGYPACRKCLYNLRGTSDDQPCPECGHVSIKRRTRWPLRQCLAASLPGLILATALPLFIIARHTHHHGLSYWLVWGPGTWLPRQKHLGTEHLGPFTLKLYQDRVTYEQEMVITPGNLGLYGYSSIYMWQPENQGEDITGDGIPDLLLCAHTGGNSFEYMLLELRNGQINETLRLPGQPSHCEDADSDGIWEYYTTTFSGSGHRPDDYKMQRLDKLIEDPTNFESWYPDWLKENHQ